MRFVLLLASVQVNLEHHADCEMQHVAKKHKDDNVIPLEELEKWADDIKSMTLGGVRPFTMYRCIGENIKPRKLGTRGVRKVILSGAVVVYWFIPLCPRLLVV